MELQLILHRESFNDVGIGGNRVEVESSINDLKYRVSGSTIARGNKRAAWSWRPVQPQPIKVQSSWHRTSSIRADDEL